MCPSSTTKVELNGVNCDGHYATMINNYYGFRGANNRSKNSGKLLAWTDTTGSTYEKPFCCSHVVQSSTVQKPALVAKSFKRQAISMPLLTLLCEYVKNYSDLLPKGPEVDKNIMLLCSI